MGPGNEIGLMWAFRVRFLQLNIILILVKFKLFNLQRKEMGKKDNGGFQIKECYV